MQLVAYGAQDIYLTGNPQITFFKVVYRRHTNFSMETIQQTIQGTSKLSNSSSGNGDVTISRNGDLVKDVYVVVSGGDYNINSGIFDGQRIIQEVEIEIGGQLIDRQTRDWMVTWTELSTPGYKLNSLYKMMGTSQSFICSTRNAHLHSITTAQIPLQFWFCRNPGLALPLIALQYHEVKIKFTWGTEWGKGTFTETPNCSVYCDYIYLDTDERRRFAQVSHEYLIEQVQMINTSTHSTQDSEILSTKLNFNHPVKELIWTYPGVFFDDIKLKLNGHDRFEEQKEEYFTLRQPYQYHTNIPQINTHLSNHQTDEISNLDSQPNWVWQEHGGFNGTLPVGPTFITASNHFCLYLHEQPSAPGSSNTIYQWRITFYAEESDLVPVSGTGNSHIVNSITSILDRAMTQGSLLEVHGGTGLASSTDGGIFEINEKVYDKGFEGTFVNVAFQQNLWNELTTYKLTKIHSYSTSYQVAVPTRDGTGNNGNISGYSIKIHARGFHSYIHNHRKIGVYSFALKPEEHQPSGTCNFSRIDTAVLEGKYNVQINARKDTVNIYAVNYNVLRIMSGMGGLAYSN